jgi:hypothetical protein
MDLFTTNRLVALVQDLRAIPPTNPNLLTHFFPSTIEEESEEIHFDVETLPRRIAPFVSPILQGKVVEDQGFTTKTYKPAYVKDKRVFNPNRPLQRMMGEALTGSMSPSERISRLVALALADQLNMLRRRKLVMASEILRTGKVTIAGEGFPTQLIDFGRAAAHTKTLAGVARWGEAGVSPVDNIEDWMLEVLQKSGAAIADVVMDVLSWRYLKADVKFEKAVDLLRVSGVGPIDVSPRAREGMVLRGVMGDTRIWTHASWYIDEAGVEQKLLPDNTVLLGSASLDGVQQHGAIRDEEAGFQAMEFYPKSWIEKDPSVRILLGQSAPLLVPYRPDASMCVTVR